MYYRILEWEKYQHYKDRSPPWIKLHRNLLTSETWVSLDNDGRVLAVASMMVAADTDNKIPANERYIRRRAYLDTDPDFKPLVDCGFLELVVEDEEKQQVTGTPQSDDSALLADASTKQADACPEKRREEKRREEIPHSSSTSEINNSAQAREADPSSSDHDVGFPEIPAALRRSSGEDAPRPKPVLVPDPISNPFSETEKRIIEATGIDPEKHVQPMKVQRMSADLRQLATFVEDNKLDIDAVCEAIAKKRAEMVERNDPPTAFTFYAKVLERLVQNEQVSTTTQADPKEHAAKMRLRQVRKRKQTGWIAAFGPKPTEAECEAADAYSDGDPIPPIFYITPKRKAASQ